MDKLFPIKGSRLASFFVLVSIFFGTDLLCASSAHAQSLRASQSFAAQLELANDPVWMSLLHYSEKRPNIYDPNFILTINHFSLSAELNATIEGFYGPHAQEVLCRFPARYFWLKQRINLPAFSYAQCEDLREFEERAPVDKIAVVYVSENIAQPSSMMGHLFLKISGLNHQTQYVEHAISFYTDAKTINVPKLIYESMVKGKKGFFTLSPYDDKLKSYVHDEQRNLWEMDLRLTPDQRRLIQLHLYELKQTEFKYFFQSYNCATVVSFIASLVMPDLREPEGIWVTPLDIAKKISSSNHVDATHVQTSNRWRLRMLQPQLPDSLVLQTKLFVEGKPTALPHATSATEIFLIGEIARAYNDYRLETKAISTDEWRTTDEKMGSSNNLDREYSLEVSEYKNPLKTPPDSQLWMGGIKRSDGWYLRTGILPASHSIEDDNRQYFGETGLHLASISLITNLETGRVSLENFELYVAQSLVPYDDFTGGLSGRFAIGVAPVYNSKMNLRQQAFIKGAVGYTFSVGADIDVYALAGAGLGVADNRGFLFANPELGLVVREVFDMKSILSISRAYNYLGEARELNELGFTQAKYFNKYAVFFDAKKSISDDKAETSYSVTFKKYF